MAHFKDLNQEQISDLWLTAQKVSTVVKNHFSGTALTFGIQDGKDAGQTIPVSDFNITIYFIFILQ